MTIKTLKEEKLEVRGEPLMSQAGARWNRMNSPVNWDLVYRTNSHYGNYAFLSREFC